MKKAVFIFLLILCSKGFSQNIVLKESELAKLLCKTWSFTDGFSDGKKVEGTANINFIYKFNADKTYTISSSDAIYANGNWMYNPKTKCVELYIGYHLPSGYISTIDENGMVLFPGRNAFAVASTLEYHFKPTN